MWSSNCFCRHPCRLGRWNKLNDRSNFFAIASVETVQLQSDKHMPLKSSAAQSYEASSPKQRASGRELSLCLSTEPQFNQFWAQHLLDKEARLTNDRKTCRGNFSGSIVNNNNKNNTPRKPAKQDFTAEHHCDVLEISLSLTPAPPSISWPFVRSTVTHWLPAHQQICLHIQETPQPIWGIKN